MSTEKLKPCPLCHANGHRALYGDVVCLNKGCNMPRIDFDIWQALPRIEKPRKFSEELPEDGQPVFVYHNDVGIKVTGTTMWIASLHYLDDWNNVRKFCSHWLPQPPPPTEEEK